MSRALLLSIKPKWVAKILNGEKTIEIRKTCPEIFKHLKHYEGCSIDVYIYCTKDKKYSNLINRGGFLTGMVVAKFTLNKVEEINRYCTGRGISYKTETLNDIELCDKSCLDLIEIDHYLYFKKGYAWHISNLVIFDRPRELGEFTHYKRFVCYDADFDYTEIEYRQIRLTKAPQSWQFIEVGE